MRAEPNGFRVHRLNHSATTAVHSRCHILCVYAGELRCVCTNFVFEEEKCAQSAGFEPARAEPNGFLVHRLNHSATTAMKILVLKCMVNIALRMHTIGKALFHWQLQMNMDPYDCIGSVSNTNVYRLIKQTKHSFY